MGVIKNSENFKSVEYCEVYVPDTDPNATELERRESHFAYAQASFRTLAKQQIQETIDAILSVSFRLDFEYSINFSRNQLTNRNTLSIVCKDPRLETHEVNSRFFTDSKDVGERLHTFFENIAKDFKIRLIYCYDDGTELIMPTL